MPRVKLGLGTAQLGLPYGLTNRRGQPSTADSIRLLAAAAQAGVEILDTAPSYGASEAVIGAALAEGIRFRIITKTPTRGTAAAGWPGRDALREGVARSLSRLGLTRLDGLLLHHAADALAPGGDALLQEMLAMKREGVVRRIGVSVYDSGELDALLALFRPDIVQLPLSVLDQRILKSGHLGRLYSLGVEVHARSVFLQGVLLEDPEALPPHLFPLRRTIKAFQAAMRESGHSPIEGALAFVLSRPEVATILVGVTGEDELGQLVASAQAAASLRHDFSPYSVAEDALVNPAKWASAAAPSRGVPA